MELIELSCSKGYFKMNLPREVIQYGDSLMSNFGRWLFIDNSFKSEEDVKEALDKFATNKTIESYNNLPENKKLEFKEVCK